MARTPSPEDVARLGQNLANLKARTNPKDWSRFVKAAHARGHTIAGELSGAPDPLKERTKSSLKTQAQKTVDSAYQPDLTQLDNTDSRVRALDAKRAADNVAYQQWLMQQQAVYAGNARDAQTKYQTYLDGLKTATADRYAGAQTAATAAAQAAPGTVSDMSQSTALQGLGADAARATGMVDNARLETAALIPSVEQGLQASQQTLLASGDARERDRMNATGKALTDISDNRFKLLASKAADSVKEYTRLVDQQIDIASSNRDYNAAADKLGLEQDKLTNTIKNQNRDYKLKSKELTLAQYKAQDSKAYHDAQTQLGYDRIKSQEGKAAADRKLRQYLHDHPAKTPKGPTSADTKYSSRLYQAVTTTLGTLQDIHKSHPNGTLSPDGHPVTFRQYLRNKGASDAVIDIAEDLRKHGGHLSAAGRKKARSIGILNPEQLWGVA